MIDRLLVMDDDYVTGRRDAGLDASRVVRVRVDDRYAFNDVRRREIEGVRAQRFAAVCMCGRPITARGCSRCRWGLRQHGALDVDDRDGIFFDPDEFTEQPPPIPRPRRRPRRTTAPRADRPPARPRTMVNSAQLSEAETAAIERAAAYRSWS